MFVENFTYAVRCLFQYFTQDRALIVEFARGTFFQYIDIAKLPEYRGEPRGVWNFKEAPIGGTFGERYQEFPVGVVQ